MSNEMSKWVDKGERRCPSPIRGARELIIAAVQNGHLVINWLTVQQLVILVYVTQCVKLISFNERVNFQTCARLKWRRGKKTQSVLHDRLTVTYCGEVLAIIRPAYQFILIASIFKTRNSSSDEIANVNFYAVRQEATRIHWNNAK